MAEDEKQCPKCAETIKAKAVVCRFCGHDMTPPARKLVEEGRKTSWLYGVGSVIGLVILARMAGCGVSPPSTSEPAVAPVAAEAINDAADSSPDARLVTIDELVKAYAANETKAQQDYGGQWLAVRGTVVSIELDLTDDPVVRLKDKGQEIALNFDKDSGGQATAELVKGGTAIIACSEISETLGEPRMRDCYVMPADALKP